MLRSGKLLRQVSQASKGILAKQQQAQRKGFINTDSLGGRAKWLEQKQFKAAPTFFQQLTRGYKLESAGASAGGAGGSRFKMPDPKTLKLIAGSVVGGLALAQLSLGHTEDFFDYRFTVKADPADLADFFGTEAAMEAFSVFPFVCNFLMRRGAWDDEGTYRVPIVLGDYLSARIEFDDRDQDPKEKSVEEKWDTFMIKSIKPGEDDDDDDEDDDNDERSSSSGGGSRSSRSSDDESNSSNSSNSESESDESGINKKNNNNKTKKKKSRESIYADTKSGRIDYDDLVLYQEKPFEKLPTAYHHGSKGGSRILNRVQSLRRARQILFKLEKKNEA